MKTVIRPAALALLLSCWSLYAHAQAPDEIAVRALDKDAVQSGIRAFERQDYPVALALLKRASLNAPSLEARLYLARTRTALRQLVAAAADYACVIEAAELSPQSPGVRRIAGHARDELAQLRPAIPSIEIALGDAEQRSKNLRLVLDGHLVTFNASLPVDPGHHEIVASDAEGEQARMGFDVGEGEAKTVGMTWRSEMGRAIKKPEQIVGGSAARRNWGVVALGVGATGLGVGTVTGIAALSRYSAAEAHCPANHCTEGTAYPDDGSAFKTLRTISAAGYIVGAAGVGTWLGLLLTTPATASEHPKVSPWTPVVGMGSAGARYTF